MSPVFDIGSLSRILSVVLLLLKSLVVFCILHALPTLSVLHMTWELVVMSLFFVVLVLWRGGHHSLRILLPFPVNNFFHGHLWKHINTRVNIFLFYFYQGRPSTVQSQHS